MKSKSHGIFLSGHFQQTSARWRPGQDHEDIVIIFAQGAFIFFQPSRVSPLLLQQKPKNKKEKVPDNPDRNLNLRNSIDGNKEGKRKGCGFLSFFFCLRHSLIPKENWVSCCDRRSYSKIEDIEVDTDVQGK